jgi:hypothetical protein
MFWTIGRRAIASIVGFSLGWIVFQIVRPADVDVLQPPAIEISSITIRHQGCVDAELECQVNDVTFHSNGLAVYMGHANDDYIGKFTGYIDQQEFQYLVAQLHQQRFFELSQHYASTPADEEIVFEVVTNEGLRRVTTHNWITTPTELRILHALVDEQVYHVEWTGAD